MCDVKIQVHRSALKHGLGVNEVVGLWGQGVEQVWLEDDRPGRWFEVVGLVFDDERVLVIHAMRLRRATLERVRRAR